MKNKVLGWLNLIFGGLGLLYQLVMLFIVYPKLMPLYQEFGAELPLQTRIYPYNTSIIILILGAIVFIGAKLVFSKSPKEYLYKIGVFTLMALLLGGGLMASQAVLSMVKPLYEITTQY